MKDIFKEQRKYLNQLDEDLETIAVASLEQRARVLKKAVEDGWFKYFLIGAGTVGAGVVYTGLTNDNNYVAGMGYGTLAMTGLYSLLYVPRTFGFFKTRKDRDNS